MLEVIGYKFNPATGLMKAIYKDCGPTPPQWQIGKPDKVLQVDYLTTRDKRADGRRRAKAVRGKKK